MESFIDLESSSTEFEAVMKSSESQVEAGKVESPGTESPDTPCSDVESSGDESSYIDSDPSTEPSSINYSGMDGEIIEVIANDRLGRKVRVKCSPEDTVGDLKKLIAAQTGTDPSKIQLKKWYSTFKDHITLADYEIHDQMSLEMY